MYQVPEGADMSMERLGSVGVAATACAAPAPALHATQRHPFAARPWHGSLLATMPIGDRPALFESHAAGLKSILANGTRRLKEPST